MPTSLVPGAGSLRLFLRLGFLADALEALAVGRRRCSWLPPLVAAVPSALDEADEIVQRPDHYRRAALPETHLQPPDVGPGREQLPILTVLARLVEDEVVFSGEIVRHEHVFSCRGRHGGSIERLWPTQLLPGAVHSLPLRVRHESDHESARLTRLDGADAM